MNRNYKVGQYCRYFRKHILHKTLKEIEGSEDVKTLSSFEHGRSSNLNHMFKYINHCENDVQKLTFINGLLNLM